MAYIIQLYYIIPLTTRTIRVNLKEAKVTGKDAIKRLEKEGWILLRIRGSHHSMKRGSAFISVPVHGNKDLDKGILHSISKDAGWVQ